MALKTFNMDGELYKEFSEHCKSQGLSMSKKVENFIRREMARLKGTLEVEKDVSAERDEEHPMERYC